MRSRSGFALSSAEHGIEVLERLALQNRQADWARNFSRLARDIFFARFAHAAKPKPDRFGFSRLDRERVMRSRFGPDALTIHRILPALHDEIVDSIFDELVPAR